MRNNFPSINIVFFYFQNYGPHDVADMQTNITTIYIDLHQLDNNYK
jgi:hypothetical protein